MGASELQAVLAVGGGAGVFSPSTRSKSASFVMAVLKSEENVHSKSSGKKVRSV